jgi:formylglycine-generating enzyme required for sulfatase activity
MLPADFDHTSWTIYRGPFWKGTAVHYRRMPNGGFNKPVGAELQPDHPMECVTWPRSIDFCKKLNKIESKAGRLPAGYEYRLPTEAEWEYACRAGTNTPFNIAEADFDKIQKIYETTSKDPKYDGLRSFAYMTAMHPRLSLTGKVGGNRKPNAWGLYDMHGNVYEWCLDTMKPYSAGAKTDPVVLGPGDKIIRGGGIGTAPRFLRSAARYAVPKDIDYYGMLGLRLVLAPKVAVGT